MNLPIVFQCLFFEEAHESSLGCRFSFYEVLKDNMPKNYTKQTALY